MTTENPTISPADRIAIFGEVLADIFPDQQVLGGAPFNVARHLRAFGLHPLLVSRTGNDALRDTLLQEMAAAGMDASGIQCDTDHPTGQVQVILAGSSHRFDILPDQAYDHICADTARQAISAIAPQLAYFGTLAQRSAASRRAAAFFLQDCACPVFLDINLRAPWYDAETIATSLASADIVKLNEEELATVAALLDLEGSTPQAHAASLQQGFALKQVLVTCGAAGSWLLDERQRVFTAAPVEPGQPVIDTVGAGDAFAAVFMLGMLKQWDTPVTLHRAGEYAAVVCRMRGAAPPSADILQPFRATWTTA